MDKLKVCNIVLTGHFPFKRKLSSKEVKNLINNSKILYSMNSEERCSFIRAFFEKDTLNKWNKKRTAILSLSLTGGININGVESVEEAQVLYDMVLSDIEKVAKDILDLENKSKSRSQGRKPE